MKNTIFRTTLTGARNSQNRKLTSGTDALSTLRPNWLSEPQKQLETWGRVKSLDGFLSGFGKLGAELYKILLKNGKGNCTYNTSSFIYVALGIFDLNLGFGIINLNFGYWCIEFDLFDDFSVVFSEKFIVTHVDIKEILMSVLPT